MKKQNLKKTGMLAGVIGLLFGCGLPGMCGYCNAQEEESTIAIIGGADGPTSIFIAGKLGEGETEMQMDLPELAASAFLQTYYTVLQKDAEEFWTAYEEESRQALEKALETEQESESGVVLQWESEVLNEMLSEGIYLLMTEEAKEDALANRYLLRAYQLSNELAVDLSLEEYELESVSQEEGDYSYSARVKAGETFYEAKGRICLKHDAETGWQIDQFTAEMKEEERDTK